MSEANRTWQMHAYRYESGALWHIGHRRWVELHDLSYPIVAVTVEELSCDPIAPEVTHYGWWDLPRPGLQKESVEPEMMQPRVGGPDRPDISPWMFLGMCFAYGIQAEIDAGKGRMVCLRVTERPEDT